MSTSTYSYAIGAGATVTAPGGVFFYVKGATAALTITTRGNTTSPIVFQNVGAGLKFGPVGVDKAWRYLDIYSAVAQVVEVIVSDDAEVDIASTVNVAGSVATVEAPASALSSGSVAPTTGTAATIAANLARKRITISNPSSNGSVFVQPVGAGAGQGIELQGGTFISLQTTAALDVRNDSGSTTTVTYIQES